MKIKETAPANASTTSNPMSTFAQLSPRIKDILSGWSQNEKQAIEDRRKVRAHLVNVEAERNSGNIAAADTKIPRRIISNNIAREKPHYVAFIEQSVRIVLFKSRTNPAGTFDVLANWFTAGMRYPGWNIPWHTTIDGMLLHGGVFIEVRLDSTRPFGVVLEAVPRENLIFPIKSRKSIQRAEMILRRYELMPAEIEAHVEKSGFSPAEVARLVQHHKDHNRNEPIVVYRGFRKTKAGMEDFWYTEDGQDWLREPRPFSLFLTREKTIAQPLVEFPFFWCPYDILEDEQLLAIKGRAALDLGDQDALTMLWSATVNGANRASKVYASRKNDPTNPTNGTATPIDGEGVIPYEVNFHAASYPDPILLQVAQALTTENMQAVGQVDFAAQNRQDSRKTAKELTIADQQAGLLSSVKLVPFSNCVRDVYTFVWSLVQYYALMGAFPVPDNVKPFLDDIYDVLPAGDTEVIRRAEKLSGLKAMYPVVANTPIGPLVLAKIVEMEFPDESASWLPMLQQPDLKPIVAQLAAIVANLPPQAVPPELAPKLQAILANAQSVLQPGGVAGGTPGLPAPSSNAGGPAQSAEAA